MSQYKANPNRQVKGGKAMVSADELKSFRKTYGEDKTLRDLLNMDKGLERKGTDPKGIKGPKDASLGQEMSKNESKEAAKSLENIQSRAKPNQENTTELSDMTFKKGGKVSSASSRGDGIAQRGKTRGALR
jgi:hypothetical protein